MKGFRNIGTLDLRKASQEALASIEFIENVGTVLLTIGQEAFANHIKQKNIGSVHTLPNHVKVITHNGLYTLSHDVMEALDGKVFFMINGTLKIEDLKAMEIENKIYKILVNGKVVAKEKDYGVLSSLIDINGESMTYKNHETYIEGDFSLEDDELYGIKEDSHLIMDTLKVLKDFDFELFNSRIKNIRVRRHIIVRKDLLQKVAQKIENYSNVPKTVVKEGYTYYDELSLKKENLYGIQSKKIHVGGTLKVESLPDALEGFLEKIICKKLEVKESDLQAIKPLLETVENIKVINPNVKSNYSNFIINEESLESFKPLKLENYGKTIVSEGLSKDLISDQIEWIINYGSIQCSEDQYGVLMNKIKENCGSVKIIEKKSQEISQDAEDGVISNLGSYEF